MALSRIPFGHAEVWVRYFVTGDPEYMMTGFGVRARGTFDSNLALSNALGTVFANRLAPLISSAYSVTPDHVVWGPFVDGDEPDRYDCTAPSVTGTQLAAAAPQNTAVLISKRTALGGRRHRGRAYIPGIAEAVIDNVGLLTSAYNTASQTSVNAIATDLDAMTEDFVQVLFHGPNNLLPPGDPGPQPPLEYHAPDDITQLVVNGRVATQRRRLRR